MSNTITVTGNITADPELRFTPNGQAVTHFSVADNRRWQDRTSQEWQEATTYFDVVAWGDLAEHTATSAAKGARVTVTGRIDQRNWETEDGSKRSKLELTATDIAVSLRWATAQVTKVQRSDTAAGEDAPDEG